MSVNPTDQEDAYFRKQDQELRQRLRDQMSAAAGQLDEQTRTADVPLADRIKALGFTGEKARVFDLMPLIHVAWADGSVSRQERATILEVVKGRGIAHGSDAFTLVETLLEARPSKEFLEQSIAVLKLAVGDARAENIVELCVQVASASGGFMNIGKVSDDERKLIESIAGQLGHAARDAFHRELG
jgi:tellurite resistance protein